MSKNEYEQPGEVGGLASRRYAIDKARAEEAEMERDRLRAAPAEAERERDALRERMKRLEGAVRRVLRRHGHFNEDTKCSACGEAHAALSPALAKEE